MILLQATQQTLLRTSSGVTERKCHNTPLLAKPLSPCDYQIFKTEATSVWETVFKHRGLLTAVLCEAALSDDANDACHLLYY